MAKIVLLMVVAVIVEAVGVVILTGGLKEIKAPAQYSASQIARVVKDGATNHKVLLGVALEAVFFGCLLYMLATRDVSFIWPLTAMGFIFTTLAAHFILGEKVSALRWAGVMLIAIGASLSSYSEATKSGDAPPAPAASSTPLGPQ
ncbi:MAG: EamA family transporter [Verrucomicrobiota bacterium]